MSSRRGGNCCAGALEGRGSKGAALEARGAFQHRRQPSAIALSRRFEGPRLGVSGSACPFLALPSPNRLIDPGLPIKVVFLSWLYAFYCFDYCWSLQGVPLAERLAFFERRWAFFAGAFAGVGMHARLGACIRARGSL